MEELALTGLASEGDNARITLRGLPGEMRAVATILTRLAERGVSVDLVNYADRADGRRQLQLTVEASDVLGDAEEICRAALAELGGESMGIERELSRVALVGSGMHGTPGVYARAFEALVDAGIDVLAVSTSSISITFLVASADEDRTLQLLHTAFGLAAG